MESELKRGFLVRQRAFLKLYLLKMIEANKRYGTQFLDDLRTEFKPYGYHPTHSEIYKTLHELTREGWVRREKKLLGEPGVDFQEIIIYHLTDKGKQEYELYRKQMKVEFDRCLGLLNQAMSDHYGPIKRK
ncbi:helix-turn-helix transcriptional regulator [Cytobacillus sp. FSL W7-1323]|uniref:Replication termination protein n=1 Tax=Cytobacillus kochii TaxID=859143 RepID=A0A286R7X3_9BACI|nr:MULTISPECIES: helix-turn-helix transcriptional regulator [Cytobacillus]ASV69751.1 Replication termination protein [Cytobacillus kochii]MDQ0184535.1 DNA-binding PadR family transcriptional regulator [Cytobacillus kochii]MEA1852245.1 helix-turn-helix transcriptional regulator [Cytobacillus sp. OWB-43]MED1606775.1 helix-turn-helix transcriptional regulator [Cytobacillus kochii]